VGHAVLGLVFALPAEAKKVLGRGGWRSNAGRKVRHGHFRDGTAFIGVQSGIGLENAYLAAQWLVKEGATALAALGVCGALSPELGAGDLILGEIVHELGNDGAEAVWAVDDGWVKKASSVLVSAGVPAHAGSIMTSREPILDSQRKKWIFEKSGAIAVDMESASVARAAAETHHPCLILRAVCDTADVRIAGAFSDCLTKKGAVRWQRLVIHLCRKPSLIKDVLELRRNFSAALMSLKRSWWLLDSVHPQMALSPNLCVRRKF
jgi:adenosylhomocysteine nucleosidase